MGLRSYTLTIGSGPTRLSNVIAVPVGGADDFDRADETPLSGGGRWRSLSDFDTQMWLREQGAASSHLGQSGSMFTTSLVGDFEAYATVRVLPLLTNLFGVALSADGLTRAFTAAVRWPFPPLPDDPYVQLQNDVTGTLVSGNIAGARFNAGDALGFTRIGSTIAVRARTAGVWSIVTTLPTDVLGPMYAALWIQEGSDFGMRWDNFVAGTGSAPFADADDLAFRQLLLAADPANTSAIVIGDASVAPGVEGIVIPAAPAPARYPYLNIGPFESGPVKLSHLYAAGAAGQILRILGIPY